MTMKIFTETYIKMFLKVLNLEGSQSQPTVNTGHFSGTQIRTARDSKRFKIVFRRLFVVIIYEMKISQKKIFEKKNKK